MATLPYRQRLLDPLLDEILAQLPALMVVGPRAAGKTTTAERRATTTIRLNRDAEAAAFEADPDAALRGLAELVLLDEWQTVPTVFGAVRRAVEKEARPGRFLMTGSVRAELENEVWPGTGRVQRLVMYPMTMRELSGNVDGPTFLDRVAAGVELTVPAETPDLRGYVELALRSGFPTPALQLTGRAREFWLESYIDDLLTHDVEQLEEPPTRKRDVQRLRRYFEACVLNSAGIPEHKTLYDAAQITRPTAIGYDNLLADLFTVDQVPAWSSNRLKRLVRRPKRYVVDPALIAAALRIDENGILRDGNLLGRILETFVAAQLRPEVRLSETRPRLYHLRTEHGRREIDLLAELGGQQLIAIEVKADAAPGKARAGHLTWLRDTVEEGTFVAGIVLHTGPRVYALDEKITAAPISVLWG